MFLITGGAGFIGSYLAKEIQYRALDDFVIVDWLSSENKWHHLSGLSPWSIIPPEEIFQFLKSSGQSISKVIHMGAISSTTATNGDEIYKYNVDLPQKLLKWCAEKEVPFIYASSAATYGAGEHGFQDREDFEYLRSLRPLNLYGWSKNLFDLNVLQKKQRKISLPPQWAGLKFFNVYGPHEDHKGSQASVAYHLFHQIEQAARAKLFKSHHPDYQDGEQQRDFVHVQDCINVMLWLIDNPSVTGLFNVGTGKSRSFNDLASSIFKTLGIEKKVDYIPTPHAIRQKYQYFTEASIDKLRKAGYDSPFYELEEGVHDYIHSYLLPQKESGIVPHV